MQALTLAVRAIRALGGALSVAPGKSEEAISRVVQTLRGEHSMAIPYYHVDAFTCELFAGSPAGVCILSAFLADSIMQKIAAENRHSETAFVVARADGDFDLRWVTPVIEG